MGPGVPIGEHVFHVAHGRLTRCPKDARAGSVTACPLCGVGMLASVCNIVVKSIVYCDGLVRS